MYHPTARHRIYGECEDIEIPDRVFSRMVDRAMLDRSACEKNTANSMIFRLNSTEPRCFSPLVDVTQARQAYGKLALPKLVRELHSQDGIVVRQAVTSIADISVNPEETARIIQLRITERLADLLLSEDPYLRERVAAIYGTMSRQAAGREAIFQHPKIVYHLSKGLLDSFAVVRIKIAQVIEILARHNIDGENLCSWGFLEMLVDLIEKEKNNIILGVHLESLESLINRSVKIRAIEIMTMEKLVPLLNNEDETIVAGALSCLSILLQEPIAKQKFIEMDILPSLKKLLDSSSRSVYKKAAAVIVSATTTTSGKLLVFELKIIDRLVELAGSANDPEVQIISMQALSNIAQVPKGKSILLEEHSMFIEDIDSRKDEATEKHKNILLKIIRSRP